MKREQIALHDCANIVVANVKIAHVNSMLLS